jgi:cell division protein FtsB
MDSNNKPDFILIWLIIFFSPIIVAIMVSIHILDIPTSNDWIGFYATTFGSLLSGLLTYYSISLSLNGVRDQIREQKEANNFLKTQLINDNEKYNEEQRLNVRPYLNEYSGYETGLIDCKSYVFQVDYNNYTYTDNLLIRIKNIGNGPIISLKVMGIKEVGQNEIHEPENEEIKSLEVGGVMNLHISYMTETSYLMNTLDIEVQYFDILDNYYKQVITVQVFRDESGKYIECIIDSISKQDLVLRKQNKVAS